MEAKSSMLLENVSGSMSWHLSCPLTIILAGELGDLDGEALREFPPCSSPQAYA